MEAALRLRKVQEQLGLSSKHAGPRGRGGPGGSNDVAMSDAVLELEHALKMLHLALRNQDFEPGSKFGGKGGSGKKGSERSLATKDSRSSYGSREFGSIRNRCQACLLPNNDDVTSLVKPSSVAYRQPRWRFSPSGRYVDPPISALRICHPELFTQSRALSERSSKKSILDDEIFNSDPFFPNLVDLSGAMERRASACSAAGGKTLLGSRDPTAQTGSAGTERIPTRLFEEVVRLMGAANRTASRAQPEQGESSTADVDNRIVDLKSRNRRLIATGDVVGFQEENTLALQGKVRQFLHALPPPFPTVTTSGADTASAAAAAADSSEDLTGKYPEDAFAEPDYLLEPLT